MALIMYRASDLVSGLNGYAVCARDLYYELGIKEEFSVWAKSKVVNDLMFEEGSDWVVFRKYTENCMGKLERGLCSDYALSLECAKSIIMMEDTHNSNEISKLLLTTP